MQQHCHKCWRSSSGAALPSTALLPAHLSRKPVLCKAQGGRSPRSTVSEASEKRRQQQHDHHQRPPSAMAGLREPRPESPNSEAHHNKLQAPPPPQQQQQQKPKEERSWWQERRRQKQREMGMTKLEEWMRDTPGFNRLVDGTLILGDAVMVIATEAASERVPLDEMPYLAAVAVLSWIIAGAALGDYKAEPDPDANPLSNSLGWPVVVAIANACITWAASMVPAMLGFSFLVSHYLVTPETVLELQRDGMLSPQLEVSVALLITMLCWRGMATRLRMRND